MENGQLETSEPVTPRQAAARVLLDQLVEVCVSRGASDVHLVAGLPPYLRIQGSLEPDAKFPALTAPQMKMIGEELLWPYDRTPLEKTGSLDGAFSAKGGSRFRFNVFRRQGELAIALRKLADAFYSLGDLGLPESLYNLCDLPDGLVLVCGPTGAGKSTTLATLLDRINRTHRSHIVTIEDPVEYIHTPVQSLVNQRQVGTDAATFNDALVASLRQDPDVILVGEIRDLATIRTAITAAETGHLVLTTVHASDCVGAIERLVSVFPADEQGGIRRQMALVLRTVVTQHLMVADGPTAMRNEEAADKGTATTATRRKRVVASEILTSVPAVANLIATAKSNQIYSAMETGAAQGMQTLEQDLARLFVTGMISEHAANNMCRNPAILRDRITILRKTGTRQAGAMR